MNKKTEYHCMLFYAACLLYLMLGIALPWSAASEAAGIIIAPIPISSCSETALNQLLAKLAEQRADFPTRISAIAAAYIGAPYVHHPLRDETSDWFPYRTVDCTMFVLCVTALANSRLIAEARQHMRLLHYRDGIVDFNHRYHFTADRITDPANRYFNAITERCVCDPSVLQRITCTLNRTKDGGYFFGKRLGSWSKTVTLAYLPRHGFHPSMLCRLPRVCGIAFIKKASVQQGVLISHEGLLIDNDLYHASPEKGVCIENGYLERIYPTTAWDGCVFFSINEVPLLRHEQ
ncbi:MAG: DUF1460 domain-containing protein [Desulfobacterota bacterium]|nr:DUF1460 domain-containing protein [Thermodesulfobacteriota bacterium]